MRRAFALSAAPPSIQLIAGRPRLSALGRAAAAGRRSGIVAEEGAAE